MNAKKLVRRSLLPFKQKRELQEFGQKSMRVGKEKNLDRKGRKEKGKNREREEKRRRCESV